jgi:hypothetical protein
VTTEWKEITDPEELFKLKREGWEIERYRGRGDEADGWYPWVAEDWAKHYKYHARPSQPKMKKVKMLAWFDGDQLFWLAETAAPKWPSQRKVEIVK